MSRIDRALRPPTLWTRRGALRGLSSAGLLGLGCGGATDSGRGAGAPGAGGSSAGGSAGLDGSAAGGTGPDGSAAGGAGGLGAPDAPPTPGAGGRLSTDGGLWCPLTEDNIEGPYFKAGSPARSAIVDPGAAGVRLALSGVVLDPDCGPIGGAVLDFWQADAAGAYDTAGFAFRGHVAADARGAWALSTIVPGRYLNGSTYRPAHVHVKVLVAGAVLLTTQLYFADDPFNAGDPFIRPSLVMTPETQADRSLAARFDFVVP